MICPNCNKEFRTETEPATYNVFAYREPVIVRADCCGTLVYMKAVTIIELDQYRGSDTIDSWGR